MRLRQHLEAAGQLTEDFKGYAIDAPRSPSPFIYLTIYL